MASSRPQRQLMLDGDTPWLKGMGVFGKSISYPELLADEGFDQVAQAQALDTEAELTRGSPVRHAARQILLRDDVQQKLRRALQRRPPSHETVYLPDEVVYFFIPQVRKARYRKDAGRWRGPAVIILQNPKVPSKILCVLARSMPSFCSTKSSSGRFG